MNREGRGARLGELLRVFGTLGVIGFGGPAAHIALMRREVVERRSWLTDAQLVDLVGVTNLIPGPNSTELAMLIGRLRAGGIGLVVAGLSFIVPAAAIVLALAWAYVTFGSTPTGEALLYGIKPVVIAIVAAALVAFARTAITGPCALGWPSRPHCCGLPASTSSRCWRPGRSWLRRSGLARATGGRRSESSCRWPRRPPW